MKLASRTTTYRHVKLESIEARFPSSQQSPHLKDGETRLTVTIEQSEADFHDGKGIQDKDVPRLRVNPSHGFAGYTREESAWLVEIIPLLWQEWDKRVPRDIGEILAGLGVQS